MADGVAVTQKVRIPKWVNVEFLGLFAKALNRGVGPKLNVSATDQADYPAQLLVTLGSLNIALRLQPNANLYSEGGERSAQEIVNIYAPIVIDEIKRRIDETHLLHAKA